MPSPLDLLLDPVTLTSLAIYGALILWEALAPARTLPAVSGWRASFHQLHHSAERLDTFGAFWFSPLDMIGWTVLSSLSLTLLGLAPEAVVLFVYFTMLLSVFQHANIRTPHWLGYLVQRPESHSRHHARGVHTGNFGDLPRFKDIATEAS